MIDTFLGGPATTMECGKYQTMIDGFIPNTIMGVLTEFGFDSFQIERIIEDNSMEILYAKYDLWDYEGEAWVIYIDPRDKQVYEVSSAHCSCNGLEWNPETTSLKAIAMRPHNNKMYPGLTEALVNMLAAMLKSRNYVV